MTNKAIPNTVDSDAIAKTSYKQMVDYLEDILVRQLEKIRNYDLDGAMALAEEANELATTIGKEGVLDKPEFVDERWRIKKLYKDIGLIIASEREEVNQKLKLIRKGIKALGLYGNNT